MGIEFFDHGGRKNRPDYLIDYVPGASSQATHNMIISSRSNDELEAMLKQVMLAHGLSANGEQPVQDLANLRRSEERRVGKEWDSKWRFGWVAEHKKNKKV